MMNQKRSANKLIGSWARSRKRTRPRTQKKVRSSKFFVTKDVLSKTSSKLAKIVSGKGIVATSVRKMEKVAAMEASGGHCWADTDARPNLLGITI